MPQTGSDLANVMAAYAAAVLAKDPARLAALYAPDVRVFDAWGVWSFEGADDWTRNLQGWLGALGDEHVAVQFNDVRLAQQNETGCLSAIVTYSAIDGDGRVLHAMQNRLSWFLTRIAGCWRIVHEHTSAPIDFDHQKAILHRD